MLIIQFSRNDCLRCTELDIIVTRVTNNGGHETEKFRFTSETDIRRDTNELPDQITAGNMYDVSDHFNGRG